ncbi:MAG: hypothetical protein DSZ07_00105 [Sulfurovum sp.]|nr:MAG: hypothetical protein DSZ07_00105 [Sulfurovum sp.]
MYTLKSLIISIFFILSPSLLFSTTYENASSKTTTKWHVLKYFSKGVIKNIYDKKKKSRVIKFNGDGTKSVYILTPKKKSFQRKKRENIFQWEMNYSEDFVIMIGMNTLKGKRYLIYTSGDSDSYLQYGLGSDSISGKWKKYSRNLQEDLEHSDRYNQIISVNSFVIKGSGMIDNIKMVQSKKTAKEDSVPILSPSPTVPKVTEEKQIVKKNLNIDKELDKKYKESKIEIDKTEKSSQPPIIYLKGENPMVLKKGERYIEPGATAKNRDGSTVEVSISEDIDIFKDGEYSVIYMATNSAGDSAIDRRRVRVGRVAEEKEKKSFLSNMTESNIVDAPLEVDRDDVDLEQRALEILDWEKQLASREEELNREKDSMDNYPPAMNYPSRPGL